MKEVDQVFSDKFTITGEVNGKVKRYLCGCYGVQVVNVDPDDWSFPIGNAEYPPGKWYAATYHDLSGGLNAGYKHSGYDINLDVSPRGDIERTLGLCMYAVCDGDITYVNHDWYGNPMLVLKGEHAGGFLWIRYGHIIPTVRTGDYVRAGDVLGTFANWRTGDHLHFDMCLDPIEDEWIVSSKRWIDPVLVMKCYLDDDAVDGMLRRDT